MKQKDCREIYAHYLSFMNREEILRVIKEVDEKETIAEVKSSDAYKTLTARVLDFRKVYDEEARKIEEEFEKKVKLSIRGFKGWGKFLDDLVNGRMVEGGVVEFIHYPSLASTKAPDPSLKFYLQYFVRGNGSKGNDFFQLFL